MIAFPCAGDCVGVNCGGDAPGSCRLQDVGEAGENGTYYPDEGYDGFASFVVNVTRAPRGVGTGIFYEAALNGQETVELEYYDPDTQEMYNVTLPNGLNVLQWETNVTLS